VKAAVTPPFEWREVIRQCDAIDLPADCRFSERRRLAQGAESPLQISDMIKKTNALLDSAEGAMRNVDQTTSNLAGDQLENQQRQGEHGRTSQ
jgi:hypothetical protein